MKASTASFFGAFAVTALLASACGSANPTAGNPTPSALGTTPVATFDRSPVATSSATPPATPRSTPKATPKPPPNPCPAVPAASAPLNPNLALVTLRGSDCVVVRDITDISHPTTISNLGAIPSAQFVSATDLSYVSSNGLVRTPLSGYPTTIVTKQAQWLFAWSPDGKTAAYIYTPKSTASFPPMQVHLVSGGKDRLLGSVPGLPSAFGCESQSCADSWDFHLAYSPDGRFISWAQSVTNVFRVWTAAGVDVTPKASSVNMTVWSGANLYFRDSKGIEVWHDGVISSFLPGVAWIRPKASPSGGQIAYERRDAAGVSHSYVVDTGSARVRELGKYRADPQFLTSRYVWYVGERLCAATECPSGEYTRSGKTYIYDLNTGTEAESVITQTYDAWPHTA